MELPGWVRGGDGVRSSAGLRAASGDNGENLLEIGDVGIGDVVIHEDHGIAVIAGLKRTSAPGEDRGGESIELEYAGGARRLIAVEDADRIWKYGADRTAVTLDGLDGTSWRKRRPVNGKANVGPGAHMSRPL